MDDARIRSEVESIIDKFPEANKKVAYDFFEQKGLYKKNGDGELKLKSLRRYAYVLRSVVESANTPFKEITKKDMTKWHNINSSSYNDLVKAFFKWVYGFEGRSEYPDSVRWLKIKKTRRLPKSLITDDDLKRLLAATRNERDKALLFCLYESACRPGEILDLKIGDVTFDQYGSIFVVYGKTGMRRVRLIYATPDLQAWINKHPRKDDPYSPLWCTLQGEMRALSYESLRGVIRGASKRAGVKKKMFAYLFRHSQLTQLANDFTESEMDEIAGWVQGSSMARTYVHLSGRNIDRKLLAVKGILSEEELEEDKKKKETLKPRPCPRRCKDDDGQTIIYSATDKFCPICGAALDLKAAMMLQEEKRTLEDQMEEFKQGVKNFNEVFKEMAEIPELKEALAKHFK